MKLDTQCITYVYLLCVLCIYLIRYIINAHKSFINLFIFYLVYSRLMFQYIDKVKDEKYIMMGQKREIYGQSSNPSKLLGTVLYTIQNNLCCEIYGQRVFLLQCVILPPLLCIYTKLICVNGVPTHCININIQIKSVKTHSGFYGNMLLFITL